MNTEKRGSNRHLKREVLALLQSDDLDKALEKLRRLPARRVINPLFSFLLSSDEQIKWRAVTAFGAVLANLASQDPESARVVMRRLMWSLNDESGGIGWGAPEAMGEIIASHEGLAREYAPVLISYIWEQGNYLEYEMLQQGALWAIGRAAQVRPDLMQGALQYLPPFLASKNATVRGLAAWAIGLLQPQIACPQIEPLMKDDAQISLYLNGRLVRRSVMDLAKEALAAKAGAKGPATY